MLQFFSFISDGLGSVIIVYLLFVLSKARQAKTECMDMNILQPIFGILVVLTKNEITKICNERNLVALFGG